MITNFGGRGSIVKKSVGKGQKSLKKGLRLYPKSPLLISSCNAPNVHRKGLGL